MNLIDHIEKQRRFSLETFGSGSRYQGIVNHIRKELIEIEADPKDLEEWIDVILLALDGAWRSGASPKEVCETLQTKFQKNRTRTWPDYRTLADDSPIEHIRQTALS